MKLQAPVLLEMKVYITDGDSIGIVTFAFEKGKYPTEQEMRKAVETSAAQAENLGHRLMTKEEFFNHMMPPCSDEDEDGETIQGSWATPGGKEWDK